MDDIPRKRVENIFWLWQRVVFPGAFQEVSNGDALYRQVSTSGDSWINMIGC